MGARLISGRRFRHWLAPLWILWILLPLAPSVHAAWYDPGWLYRQKITVVPAVTDSDLSHFPYLVKITNPSNSLFANAQPDGDDILFTGSDGASRYEHEIEKYDSGAGELFAWVRIPLLSSTGNTEIYMYYGNSGVSSQQNPAAVWDDDFVMVQHLQETSGNHFDSAGSNHGSPSGGVDQNASDQIDGSDRFDGLDDRVNVADSVDLRVVEMTLEAWVYLPNPIPGGWRAILNHAYNTNNWYGLWKSTNGDFFHFRWSVGGVRRTEFATTIVPERWYYVVGVLDPGADKAYAYLDGQLDTPVDGPSLPTVTAGTLTIGSRDSVEWFEGIIDEVRISKKARSQDWIEACFRNQHDPDDYQILSGQEPDPGPPGDITDLATGAVRNTTLELTWTAPGDDGTVGTATTYEVRYSTSPIDSDNWDSATQATGEPLPQVAGSAESFTVTGLSPGVTYWFAIKTADEVPNWSGLSNVVSATTSTEGDHIEGNVYEEVNGDSDLGDAAGRQNVAVRLYEDGNANGLVDAADTFMSEILTDATGFFSFDVDTGVTGTDYLIAVDSRSVAPSAGFNGGSDQDDVWAEQTSGDDVTTAVLDVGSRFGGRTGGVSDGFDTSSTAPADNEYEHLARIDLGFGDALGVDFGFSFNVVTNLRGGDTSEDDDGGAARTIQGGFRQFLENANSIFGANAMRFVPAVVSNASGGNWWQFAVSDDLPELLDSDTTVDGTTYSHTDGVSLRDENPGSLGTGGTVGTDGLSSTTLGKPEFEIFDADNRNIGLDLQVADVTVRRLAIYGFGDAEDNDGEANIRVGEVTGTLIEECVIGTSAQSFGPGVSPTADNIRIAKGDSGTIRNSLIGFSEGNGIAVKEAAGNWLIEGNEIRGNGLVKSELNGISMERGGGHTIRGNLIRDNDGSGIDMKDSTGGNTIVNNTIHDNGIGTNGNVETPGIRLFGTGSSIDRNVIYENFGAGLMVTKSAIENTITRNSIYDNGTILNNGGAGPTGQIGIDLLDGGDDDRSGDSPFYTLNDTGDTDGDANTLLNYPILESAAVTDTTLILAGFAGPGSTIELFVAQADPSGFGEGRTYQTTLTEGSVDDQDATTGSYGPGPINGIAQGQDTTNRFHFEIPIPPGVATGRLLTATATDAAGDSSEFSGTVQVTGTLAIEKRAFDLDGNPITDGTTVARGGLFKFLLYINNTSGAQTDISVQDLLDSGFAYQTGTIKVDNSVAECSGMTCSAGEEAAIFASVDTQAVSTDAVGDDTVSYTAVSTTIDAGNENQANLQLDIAGHRAWALVFTVRMR